MVGELSNVSLNYLYKFQLLITNETHSSNMFNMTF